MRPNLDDPAALAAYRRELRGLARWWRALGFALVLWGAAAWLYGLYAEPERPALMRGGWVAIGLGWAIFIGVIVYRTRYHKARMAEPAES